MLVRMSGEPQEAYDGGNEFYWMSQEQAEEALGSSPLIDVLHEADQVIHNLENGREAGEDWITFKNEVIPDVIISSVGKW